ncbi:HAD domain-containing protein [Algoriphagus taiwanensis]|uniref:FCP1 homology domain-containing protein n=1 Tax=Algoriphagus taiwanensis TaxID=1445656 RepID=A0ABQ6Q5R9_9BACT|nr:hypothetical protein Ataiwa_38020 [Algoriphagus taiwanensis]
MLIFLDIDGVMVSGATWKVPETLEDGFPVFLEKAVRSLNSLITPDTKIILSTSHRDRFTLHEWKKVFLRRGIVVNKLDRFPYAHGLKKRKDEILEWFATHSRPKDFVIIDDDKTLYDLPKDLKEHLIVTSPYIGLTMENLQEVRGLELEMV